MDLYIWEDVKGFFRRKKSNLIAVGIVAWGWAHYAGYVDAATFQLGLIVLGGGGVAALRAGMVNK